MGGLIFHIHIPVFVVQCKKKKKEKKGDLIL